MGFVKNVFGDSAIFGVGAMLTRALSYALTPIHTYAFPSENGDYAVVTQMYGLTAIASVLLTFGMETTYFNYWKKYESEERKRELYSSILVSVGLVCLLFTVAAIVFIGPIAAFMKNPDHPYYVLSVLICIAFDAFHSIPSSYLRQYNLKMKYIGINLEKAGLILLLNLVYFLFLPMLGLYPFGLYGPQGEFNVKYIFYINAFASIVTTFFYWKEISVASLKINVKMLRSILGFGLTLVLSQLAGQLILNSEKVLYPYWDTSAHAEQNLAVYGGAAKLAVFLTLFNSLFNLAFNKQALNNTDNRSNKSDMARMMKWYVIVMLLAFLGVNALMNVVRLFIAPDYWSALFVVPVIMGAIILFGIYQNLIMGYKQLEKNRMILFFIATACALFLFLNWIFVPLYGYAACAWAQLASFGLAVILSYTLSFKVTRINYPVSEILRYIALALLLFLGMKVVNEQFDAWYAMFPNMLLLFVYIAYLNKKEPLDVVKMKQLAHKGIHKVQSYYSSLIKPFK